MILCVDWYIGLMFWCSGRRFIIQTICYALYITDYNHLRPFTNRTNRLQPSSQPLTTVRRASRTGQLTELLADPRGRVPLSVYESHSCGHAIGAEQFATEQFVVAEQICEDAFAAASRKNYTGVVHQ